MIITPKIFSEITAQVAAAIEDAYTSPSSRFADAESFLAHTNRKLDEIVERFASLGGIQPDVVSDAVAGVCETWMQLNGPRYEVVAPRFAQEKVAEVHPRCRVCGCTDGNCEGCIARTGSPCHWVEPDLCSACAPQEVSPLVRGATMGVSPVGSALPLLFDMPKEGGARWPG